MRLKFPYPYRLDIWSELQKYWILLTILISIMVAVISPDFGTQRGHPLTRYVSLILECCIYYKAGRNIVTVWSKWSVVVSAVLSFLVAPLIAVALCGFGVTEVMFVKGMLLTSTNGPNTWLSLLLISRASSSNQEVAVSLVITNTILSYVCAPIYSIYICEKFTMPYIGPSIQNLLTLFIPYFSGVMFRWYADRRLFQHTSATERDSSTNCVTSIRNENCDIKPTASSRMSSECAIQSPINKENYCDNENMALKINMKELNESDFVNLHVHGSISEKSALINVVYCKSLTTNLRFFNVTVRDLVLLIMIYIENCTLLSETEGMMYVADVLGAVVFVLLWTAANVAITHATTSRFCDKSHASAVLLITLCKGTHFSVGVCAARRGAAAMLVATTRSLLLTAIVLSDSHYN